MPTMTALPASTELAHSHAINHDGRTDTGPLIADDNGLAVDISTRSGFKKMTRRYYLVRWPDITSATVEAAAPNMVGGSTVNAHKTVVTVVRDGGSFTFRASRDVVAVRNLFGKHSVAI